MGVLKVRDAAGNWVPVGIGAVQSVALYSATAAGGNVNTGTSPQVVTLTTPIIPVGAKVLVTWAIRAAQNTAAVFDVIYNGPSFSATHQQGSGAFVSGWMHSYAASFVGAGAAMTFNITLNNWGGQTVSVGTVTNISALVLT